MKHLALIVSSLLSNMKEVPIWFLGAIIGESSVELVGLEAIGTVNASIWKF